MNEADYQAVVENLMQELHLANRRQANPDYLQATALGLIAIEFKRYNDKKAAEVRACGDMPTP